MEKPKILFLCTGNSCRSQMAEGWAKHFHPDTLDAFSAGTEPHGMNERAMKVMAEAGIDLSLHTSKHIDSLENISFDIVLTVCDSAQENCPVVPSTTKTIHYSFGDPPHLAKDSSCEEGALSHYRKIRDEIRDFVSNAKNIGLS